MDRKTKLFVAIPSVGSIVDSQVYALREIENRYKDWIEFVYPKQLVQRIFHDSARNGLVEEFLESECDIMWFLDSDVAPPKHILDLITIHSDKWQAAGAPYPIFVHLPGSVDSNPKIAFTAYKNSNETKTGMALAAIPDSGIDIVDGLATGCLFIKREVFSKLEKPYFEFKYNKETRVIEEGEDLGFCLKLQKLGIKFFTDYSMVCKHKKTVCLLELNNYAIEYANAKIGAYDSFVREQVQKLAGVVESQKAKILELEKRLDTRSKLILPGA